jgi:F-type H+-transporting ATPase subunit b
MEIFHAFGIEWKLLVIQMINFAIALFVLHRYAYTPIVAILAKREREISDGLAAAARAKETERGSEVEKERIIREARDEGGKIIDAMRKEGTESERKQLRDAAEKSVAIIESARMKADEERAYILREAEKDVAKAAILAAEKILRAQAHAS